MATTLTSPNTKPKGLGNPPRPKLSTHLQLVSPKQARELLDHNAFAGQRPRRPWHVGFLRQVIEDGNLRPGTTITFALLDGQRILVNGQHTLAALGDTTGGPIWLQVEEITVETAQDVSWLYESFDRNLARSWADLYRSNHGLQALELLPKHLRLLGGCVVLLACGFANLQSYGARHQATLRVRQGRRRTAMLQDWSHEMFNFINGCQGPKGTRHLLERAAVLTVALVTYRFQPEQAHLFWPSLARDSGLSEGMPAHTLLRHLRETPARAIQPATYARAVASSWNAAFEGRQQFKISARGSGQPLLLAGTPHDGKATYVYLRADGTTLYMPERVDADT